MLSLISLYVTEIYFLQKNTLLENFKTVWKESRAQVVLAVRKKERKKKLLFGKIQVKSNDLVQ